VDQEVGLVVGALGQLQGELAAGALLCLVGLADVGVPGAGVVPVIIWWGRGTGPWVGLHARPRVWG